MENKTFLTYHFDNNNIYTFNLVRTHHSWLKVHKYCPWNVFSWSRFTEESVESIVTATYGLVTGHLTIWLYSMFQTVQFPACIAHLHSSLTNMNANHLTLKYKLRLRSSTFFSKLFLPISNFKWNRERVHKYTLIRLYHVIKQAISFIKIWLFASMVQ